MIFCKSNVLLSGSSQYGAVVCIIGCNWKETQAWLCPSLKQVTCSTVRIDANGEEKTGVETSISSQCPRLCNVPATVKVDSVVNGRNASLELDFPVLKVKKEIPEGIDDDLDHIVLKERQRMLLARYFMLIVDIFHFDGAIGHTFCLTTLPNTMFLNLLKQQMTKQKCFR